MIIIIIYQRGKGARERGKGGRGLEGGRGRERRREGRREGRREVGYSERGCERRDRILKRRNVNKEKIR